MSKPIVSIANLDNKSAAEAIIDYAGDFFASITLEDIPSILKDILDNLKSVGKQVIDKIKDFILNDFWGLVIDTKDIIKSLLNQQLDKALNCASRAMDKLEKVLDVLSYIPCLSVAIGVILIVIYICQLDFAAIASAAICMLGPLKILTKIFPKSKNIINKLTDFLVDFGKRFKDQAKTSLRALIRKNKNTSTKVTNVVNIEYGITKQKRKQIQQNKQQVVMRDGTYGNPNPYEISNNAQIYSTSWVEIYTKPSSNTNKIANINKKEIETKPKKENTKRETSFSGKSTEKMNNTERIIGYGSPDYNYNDRILGQGSILNRDYSKYDSLIEKFELTPGDAYEIIWPYNTNI